MDGIVFTPGQDEGYVALSRTPTGRLFKKHILSKGTLHYPGVKGGKVQIDDDFMDRVVENFKKGTAGIVQFPVADANNNHTESPLANIGEIVDVKKEGDKLYSYIDVRDETAAPKVGKTILGASAMLSLNYTDTRTGQKAGPTLLHVAATNRPHVVDLEEFQELAALSADSSNKAVFLTALTEEKTTMDLDELIATLRDEHNIDVPALQATAADAANVAKLTAELTEALSEGGVLKLSATDEGPSTEDIVAAVTQLAQDRVELTGKVDALVEESKKSAAVARVDAEIAAGKILPAKREANINLLLSNAETFEELLPEKPLVALSAESGFVPADETPDLVIADEIARLTAYGKEQGLTIEA